jgi:hypothetical protein
MGAAGILLIDAAGTVVEVEDEVALDSIPAPAKAAIEKSAGGAKSSRLSRSPKAQL